MRLSEELDKEIQKGMAGKSNVIPVTYERVGDHIDIAKNSYYAVGAETGSGKTSLCQEMFTIHPIEWYLNNQSSNIKLSVIGFFMERKQFYYSARWISRKLFQNEGIHLSPDIILPRKKHRSMTPGEYELVKRYYRTLDEWQKEDLLIVHEGSKNPSGVSIYLEQFAAKHGIIHKKDKSDKSMENTLATVNYEPHHPNHIIIVITDNTGILAPEGDGKAKTLVDKHSRTMREARDWYGMSPVVIQQLNRSLSDIHRQKLGDLVPKLSDFAASSQTQNDSDVCW